MAIANAPSKILLSEGVLSYKKGATTGVLGLTRGGSFTDNFTVRNIEYDGKKGNTKGDAWVEGGTPTIEFKLIQMESEVLELAFANLTVVDDAGVKTITRKVGNIADTEYIDEIYWTGETKEGKERVIKITEALGQGPLAFDINDKGEVEIPASWTGNYSNVSATAMPYEIKSTETP